LRPGDVIVCVGDYRRLLTKSESGEQQLRAAFQASGPAMATHSRLSGTTLFKGDPDVNAFVRFYPFLPQHFELLLELIRTLARSTGGVGLRSANACASMASSSPPASSPDARRPVTGSASTLDRAAAEQSSLSMS
jgi:hypothetical protein